MFSSLIDLILIAMRNQIEWATEWNPFFFNHFSIQRASFLFLLFIFNLESHEEVKKKGISH